MRNFRLVAAFVILFGSTSFIQAATTFNFVNNGPLDGSGAGVSMTEDGIVLSNVSFSYPDLSNAPTIGAITSSGGQTNILSPDGLGIDNPTISASSFSSNFGSGTEQSNFNFDETWVFDFGTPVVVDSIDFDSLDGGTALDTFTFSIAGSSFMFTNSNTDGSDISTDPFSGLVIAAGQDISVSFSAADNSAAARIASITVAAVPEPSSLLALLGVASAGSIIRRRRS